MHCSANRTLTLPQTIYAYTGGRERCWANSKLCHPCFCHQDRVSVSSTATRYGRGCFHGPSTTLNDSICCLDSPSTAIKNSSRCLHVHHQSSKPGVVVFSALAMRYQEWPSQHDWVQVNPLNINVIVVVARIGSQSIIHCLVPSVCYPQSRTFSLVPSPSSF